MRTVNKITLAIILLTIVIYLVSFLVPLPQSWQGSYDEFHWALANSALYAMLHIGAAILFLSAVNAYKVQLRAAYMTIALGVVLVGVGLAHVVFLNIFGLLQSPWVQYGGVLFPFLGAGLTMYFGTRSMARLVDVSSAFARVGIVFPVGVVSVVAASLIPHAPAVIPELSYDFSNAINVWNVILYAASLGIVLRIKSRIGMHYTASMAWLAIGLIGSVIITTYVLIGSLFVGQTPEGRVLELLVISGGCLYFLAGYSFAKTKEL
ncbi:MAG TPA: hypothetical protein VFT59_01990 [Candidatus Saccharimonadales bacterium]|nr:hypothetical protein [Candidatus Saccharimonadales bacterium]